MLLSNLILIRSLYVGKLLADRDSQNLLRGIDQFAYSYAEQAGGFQIYFFSGSKKKFSRIGKKKRKAENSKAEFGMK